MNFLKRLISLFLPSYFNKFYSEIGDRIMFKDKKSDRISIVNNKNYNLKWGVFYVLIGLSLFLYFAKGHFSNMDFASFSMFFLISIPALLIATTYFIKARSNNKVIFSLSDSKITIDQTSIIPFSSVDKLTLTKLEGIRGPTSYHLNLIVKSSEITLFRDESYEVIYDSAEFISKSTNIQLDKKVQKA